MFTNNMIGRLGLMILLSLLISACGSRFSAAPTPIPLPVVGASTDSTPSDSVGSEGSGSESTEAVATSEAGSTNSAATEVVTTTETTSTEQTNGAAALVPTATAEAAETESSSESAQGIAAGEASDPVQLDIERIRLSVPITPMDWRIVKINDQRTTDWIIPDDTAGWHPDSVGVGGAGNMVISGYQNGDGAVFSQLALGNVQVGMEIMLTASDGTAHMYVVTEVGTPIPLDGTSAAEADRVAEYYAPSEDARLTLVTGWPSFTTTHRLFIVALLAEG